MKINTTEDIDQLDQKIKTELGIDIQKYRNEEVVENFAELLVFPIYIINWVIRPIIFSITIYLIGFFIFNLVHIEYVIYGIIGLILFLGTGFLFGLLFFIWKMKSDILGITNYSLEIMKSAVVDMNKVNNKITPDNKKNVLGLLFKGIIHIVTIPLISRVIADKVPFIGSYVNRIINKTLTIIANKAKFDETNLKNELTKKEGESNILKVYSDSISSVSLGLEKTVNFTFKVVRLPIIVGAILCFFMLIPFLYFIN